MRKKAVFLYGKAKWGKICRLEVIRSLADLTLLRNIHKTAKGEREVEKHHISTALSFLFQITASVFGA